jgi:2-polyprenyl-3-methyl-5-hydroxy-6-metoxy-1,4-benzoquinol methylase
MYQKEEISCTTKRTRLEVPPKAMLKDLASGVGTEVHHYYSWNILVKHVFSKRLMTAITIAGPTAFLRVLDLGCGSAFLSLNLARHGADTLALDLYTDVKRVKSVMDKLVPNRIHFMKSDGANLPFKSSSFDVVFALDVLEHMCSLHQAIDEIHRILKPRAVLVASIPYEGDLLYRIGSAIAVELGEKSNMVSTKQEKRAPHVNTFSDVTDALKWHFHLEKKSEILSFPRLFLVASYRKL